jgi:glycerol-3-phosphate acyltransferase PlsX
MKPYLATIAVDAMGGDKGCAPVVEGALAYAQEYGGTVILVGRGDKVSQELCRHRGSSSLPIKLQEAAEVVEMDDPPSIALRRKKDSSIRVGIELVKRGEAAAFVSAGNTGAVMATAVVVLGNLPEVERPAIAAVMPTLQGNCVLLDVGANVDCKPRQLLQFAIMGNIYAKDVLGKKNPRVGLLSIGEEETKGNELTREAFKSLEEEPSLIFVGMVEGSDLFSGNVDVVVCDGFTGNVALKFSESTAEMIGVLLRQELGKTLPARVGYWLSRHAFERFKKRVDYTEYGGAPLLGVNGICIISHGRSTAKAIKNAIRVAQECVQNQVIVHIREGIQDSLKMKSLVGSS